MLRNQRDLGQLDAIPVKVSCQDELQDSTTSRTCVVTTNQAPPVYKWGGQTDLEGEESYRVIHVIKDSSEKTATGHVCKLRQAPAIFAELPEIVTVAQAAKALSVSKTTVYNEIAAKRIKCIHVGKCVRITRQQLQEYVLRGGQQ